MDRQRVRTPITKSYNANISGILIKPLACMHALRPKDYCIVNNESQILFGAVPPFNFMIYFAQAKLDVTKWATTPHETAVTLFAFYI